MDQFATVERAFKPATPPFVAAYFTLGGKLAHHRERARWFAVAILLFLVTLPLSQIERDRFSIGTRFYRKLDFQVSGHTEFVCHKQLVPLDHVHLGDLVEIRFRSTKSGWQAERVTVRVTKTECATR